MKYVSAEKLRKLEKLSTDNQVISALAIDQRGSLRKMISAEGNTEDIQSAVEKFKIAISEELTSYSSSILLDPEYGLPAAKRKNENAGLLLAYEETGYDATEPGRLPDLLPYWSAKRIEEIGADAVKFLLYYDADESNEINDQKKAFVERIGSECDAEEIPYFLEILTYDKDIDDNKSKEFAKVKPRKVIKAIEEFSKDRYGVDVLKVEVPVNMNFVEGFSKGESVYTKEEASQYFADQDAATHLPYIYLSAGVSAQMFQDTLVFAKESGAKFNGVLCGRATWKDSVPIFAKEGENAAREWLKTEGVANIESLNKVLDATASSWSNRIGSK
ncbi:tagatose-bisphosphate aldolase [Aerococcus agrisoli]|uniref:Tagatose 1,6-diphosphate aldolase n=1 Tax=Aerococcus agrisoli TaxID=2487350 RepID=A0A3N4GJP8_9LACT|nr:tagatose-bisphosphate aldolase [Aerococcus agrisoli]RPA59351.1 tagatose-bisphosphate aldolase [Aerococcus agrisoli]